MSGRTINRRFVDGVTMFVVTGLSLLLLVYVAFAEGKRIDGQFQLEKLIAQAGIVQNSMENYLRAGLPLKDYVGFNAIVEPMVGIEEVDAAAVHDESGRQLFLVVDKKSPTIPAVTPLINTVGNDPLVDQDGDTHHQIVLPLRTRFGTAGTLVVYLQVAEMRKRLDSGFQPLLYAAFGLSFLFAVVVSLSAAYLARARAPWLQIGYAITFLVMAGLVLATLLSLYSDGAKSKAKASAFTLSERLKDIPEFNLRFRDFSGLEKVFSSYKQLNPEIDCAALVMDGRVEIASDPSKVGKTWVADGQSYEYVVQISRPGQARQVSVAVSIPTDIVYKRVERSVRNFLALFVASGFLAGLFLQVASSMQRVRETNAAAPVGTKRKLSEETALIIVKPIFFLSVFIEHLTYSFLPRFMQDAAVSSGFSAGFASAPFTAYYLCFALSLIPAGHFADRNGPRSLIWLGLVLASASLFGLAAPAGLVPLIILRALSGVGQGMLFIGIQSYILAVASPEKKTQAAAIIVFGFQGGMISGMAIGSLLVSYLHPEGVFLLSAAIGVVTAIYSLVLVPGAAARVSAQVGLGAALKRLGNDVSLVARSGEFLKTMFFIGVPAKAVLTGAVTFALPLLLTQQGYRPEEVGQIIMLYGIGVVAASGHVSRLVDRTGSTELVLFGGAAISGIGLVLVGLMGSNAVGSGLFSTLVIIAGVVVVGLAHGFINAPVVTHVAHSDLAGRIGAAPVTATYRFLERIGHIAGPFLVGQFFLFWGQTPQILAWIGVGIMTLGLCFLTLRGSSRTDAFQRGAA